MASSHQPWPARTASLLLPETDENLENLDGLVNGQGRHPSARRAYHHDHEIVSFLEISINPLFVSIINLVGQNWTVSVFKSTFHVENRQLTSNGCIQSVRNLDVISMGLKAFLLQKRFGRNVSTKSLIETTATYSNKNMLSNNMKTSTKL
jgi:hypothetical protein